MNVPESGGGIFARSRRVVAGGTRGVLWGLPEDAVVYVPLSLAVGGFEVVEHTGERGPSLLLLCAIGNGGGRR